jgi:hypothetical protein
MLFSSVQEEVRDLLWTNSSAPRPVVTIRELPTGVSLAGACERQVNSREEMSHVLMQGTLMRAVAATNMNNRYDTAAVLNHSTCTQHSHYKGRRSTPVDAIRPFQRTVDR